jgi:hypothetical protein
MGRDPTLRRVRSIFVMPEISNAEMIEERGSTARREGLVGARGIGLETFQNAASPRIVRPDPKATEVA